MMKKGGIHVPKIYQPTDNLPDRKLSDEGIVLWKGASDWTEPEHTHNFIEFVYVFSGRVEHIIDGVPYTAVGGDLLFINFGQTHAHRPDGEVVFCNILIQPEFLSEQLINSSNAADLLTLSVFADFSRDLDAIRPFTRFRGKTRRTVEGIIDRMEEEFRNREIGFRDLLKSTMSELLIYMFRQMRSAVSTGDLIHHMDTLSPLILQYIEGKCCEPVSMTELARRCYYNPSYFSRIFKKCFGKTFMDLVREKRMEKARELLLETDKSVADIAAEVGYPERKNFYATFTRFYGETPGRFRKEHKTGQDEK